MHCQVYIIGHFCTTEQEKKKASQVELNEIIKESCKSQRSHQNSWMVFLRPGKEKYSCVLTDLKNIKILAVAT